MLLACAIPAQFAAAQPQTTVGSPAAAASIDRPDHPDAARLTAANVAPPSGPMQEIYDSHNKHRALAGFEALIWSRQLAQEADGLVEQVADGNCSAWAANSYTEDQRAGFYWAPGVRGIGGSSAAQDLTARFVASEWHEEGARDYSYAEGACTRDTRSCRAYALLMDPSARRIGCDFTVCSNNAQVWICRFEGERIFEARAQTAPR